MKEVDKALLLRGFIYFQENDFDKAEKDYRFILGIDGVPISLRMIAYFKIAELFIRDGRWDEAITMLGNGLEERNTLDNYNLSNIVDFISSFFGSNLALNLRKERIQILAKTYQNHNAISLLGDMLIKHLGTLYSCNVIYYSHNAFKHGRHASFISCFG